MKAPRAAVHAALVAGGAACAAGAALGLTVRLVAGGATPAERASAAGVALLGAVACVAPALPRSGPRRAVRAAGLCGLAAAAAWTASAGSVPAPGACLVVAACAALACGAADAAARLGVAPSSRVLVGACAPLVLVAGVFLADPFVEWEGSVPASPARAAALYRANPVAALTSSRGGTGVAWQTRPLLYDGAGTGGLSVIGRFYAVREPAAGPWSACALAVALLLSCAGLRRSDQPLAAS